MGGTILLLIFFNDIFPFSLKTEKNYPLRMDRNKTLMSTILKTKMYMKFNEYEKICLN